MFMLSLLVVASVYVSTRVNLVIEGILNCEAKLKFCIAMKFFLN